MSSETDEKHNSFDQLSSFLSVTFLLDKGNGDNLLY